LADAIPASEWTGEALQAAIFAVAKEDGLAAGVAFAAIYLAFLGRRSGPRAGWLLAALDRDFVIGRLREASTSGVAA
jgi:lysyl-tRNA synthetase class 1